MVRGETPPRLFCVSLLADETNGADNSIDSQGGFMSFEFNDNDPCPGGCGETVIDCTCPIDVNVALYQTPEFAHNYFRKLAEMEAGTFRPDPKVLAYMKQRRQALRAGVN
jgi:hypothetical protein